MPKEQGPPLHIPATNIIEIEVRIDLPATYVGKQPKPGKDPIGGGFSMPPSRAGGMGSGITNTEGLRRITIDRFKSTETAAKAQHDAQSKNLSKSTEVELANARAKLAAPTATAVQTYQNELNARNVLIQRKTIELKTQNVLANAFYGHNPLKSTSGNFLSRAKALDRRVIPQGPAFSKWAASYKAAYSAKLLTEQIQLLNNQKVQVQKLLAAAQVQEQQIAVEKARKEQEVKTQREADAKLKALNDLKETLGAVHDNRPFPMKPTVTSGPVFTLAAGRIAISATPTLAVRTALQAGSAAVVTAVTASASAVLVGFAALLFPSSLGNSDLYALSVPLSDLMPGELDDLYAIAEAKGEVRLPVVIGSKNSDDSIEYFVAATDGTSVPSAVPIRLASFDPGLNVYRTDHPNAPSSGMTWTPVVRPGDASTALPVKEPEVAAYNGTTLVPLDGRIDTSPALDLYDFGGFIYVFPVESGIAPQYLVFNSPYEGASTTGEHSGRDFNSEQTGGPILDLEWQSTTTSQEGVVVVKLHTSRFPPSDANKVMIDRLERILRGELEMTDIDKRFYTHEIREFERIKALGYSDTEPLDENSPIWNNVHTATLEDYKLKDDETLLYTAEALAAAAEQDNRYYQKLLREMWQ